MLGIDAGPQVGNRSVDRPANALEGGSGCEFPALGPRPLVTIPDQIGVQELVRARVVGGEKIKWLVLHDPGSDGFEVAVQTFDLLEVGVEINAVAGVLPPISKKGAVGHAGPRPDQFLELVRKILWIGSEAIEGATV